MGKRTLFLGRAYDLKAGAVTDEAVEYDADDLTTHGVVMGMTGSGKTGLCVDLLEEAALQGIPALLIDPKGDLANLLLHFPELRPEDFAPWVEADEARREGISIEELAARTADRWREGLAEWGMGPERIRAVTQAVEYAVYTPGSDAGLPVSILASLAAPDLEWEENADTLREKIAATVTALLGLVGIDADPVQSREHILLANLFEGSWRAGKDMELTGLIHAIQAPPFKKLGAMDLEQFYPRKEREQLAMRLNALLASPSFRAWTEGAPLEIGSLLWNQSGKPRHSLFYLAHLSEAERMFFVTLLLSAVEAWMRAQPGSPSLRALIYIDEALGFLPPVAEPPSKATLIRLLKQARAYGLGVLLTTQNPVDLDYKALGNAGTWFVGKLQTEQDKARLLDGLEGVDASLKRGEVDRLISALDKRVFLLHNVHAARQQVFYTRWAMAYLKGPITRTQVPALNALVGATLGPAVQAGPGETGEGEPLATKPAAPEGIREYFTPANMNPEEALAAAGRQAVGARAEGVAYRAGVLAQAEVRYTDGKSGLDHRQRIACLAEEPDRTGTIRWEDWLREPLEARDLDPGPAREARFWPLHAPFSDGKAMRALEKEFADYIYREGGLRLWSNPKLKLVADPGMTKETFLERCAEAARQAADDEIESLREKYEKKVDRLRDRLAKEQRELEEDQAELSGRKLEEVVTHAENLLSIFGVTGRRRRVSTSLTKRRMTSRAKADVEESLEVIQELQEELQEIEAELQEEIEEIEDRWEAVAETVEEKVVSPYKKDIRIELFGIAWIPHWRIVSGQETFEVLAYRSGGG